jgi:hypothetical protein
MTRYSAVPQSAAARWEAENGDIDTVTYERTGRGHVAQPRMRKNDVEVSR